MIDSDPRIKKTLAILKSRPKLDVDSLVDKVFAYHKRLPERKPESRHMASAQMTISGIRSRVAAIKMECLREKVFLESQQVTLEKYVRTQYMNYLSKSTAPTQVAIIHTALRPLIARITPLENAIQVIDVCLEDFDKVAWTYKGVNDSLSLSDRA